MTLQATNSWKTSYLEGLSSPYDGQQKRRWPVWVARLTPEDAPAFIEDRQLAARGVDSCTRMVR